MSAPEKDLAAKVAEKSNQRTILLPSKPSNGNRRSWMRVQIPFLHGNWADALGFGDDSVSAPEKAIRISVRFLFMVFVFYDVPGISVKYESNE